MAYNVIKPVKIFDAVAMTASRTSEVIEIMDQDNVAIQLNWTGAPVGTFSFQISNDYVEDDRGNVLNQGNWITLPLSPAISAAGSPDQALVDLNQMGAAYVRVVFNFTSGSGTLNGFLTAKGI